MNFFQVIDNHQVFIEADFNLQIAKLLIFITLEKMHPNTQATYLQKTLLGKGAYGSVYEG